ncbi:MAG: amidohydrolase family protein [Verrucomicrobia bacterium]|nr:amidohydrolase family protein [Verrucomicrobiota bacterium]
MAGPKSFALRARVILPVSQPAIEDGAVFISRGRIAAVGRWRDLRRNAPSETRDLGEAILLPGLVNAHCHLDYTDMAGAILPPKTFLDWIQGIVALKSSWSYTDFAQSWLNGVRQLLHSGCTTVADIEAVPELLPEVWASTPLRVLSFLEIISVRRRQRPARLLRQAVQKIRELPEGRSRAALSPHALYTTNPELLKLARRISRRARWPLTMHVAESGLEFGMFRNGRGAMFDWLRKNGRDMADCGSRSPVQQLAFLKLLDSRFLAVHVNQLALGDADLLARAGAHVVHCPRSHAYFGHTPFPFAELHDAGVNLCLGTDSLASIGKDGRRKPELDLFAELRAFTVRQPGLSPEEFLDLVTRNSAAALGQRGKVGELTRRAHADMLVLRSNCTIESAAETVVHAAPKIAGVMIGGQWAIEPPR